MSSRKQLTVIAFQNPWPADYGGAVDLFFKLKALKRAGVSVHLHTFQYDGRTPSPELESLVEKVWYYPRERTLKHLFSRKPFIVESRRNNLLLERLRALPPGSPILFEGLHTTLYLPDSGLADKLKIVRTHNVEHEYYALLAKAGGSLPRRLFHIIESSRLRRYEKVLRHADVIMPISEADRDYFASRFPDKDVRLLNCFFNDESGDAPAEECQQADEKLLGELKVRMPYVLYHGNLSVAENSHAAEFLLREVVPRLKGEAQFVIAGKNPPRRLTKAAEGVSNVVIVPSPSGEVLDALVRRAAVHEMITFQPTGIKLKLVNTLFRGNGHIIANDSMLNDSRLVPLCVRANTPEQIAAGTLRLLAAPLSDSDISKRGKLLSESYSNDYSIKVLTELLSQSGS